MLYKRELPGGPRGVGSTDMKLGGEVRDVASASWGQFSLGR